MQVLTPTGYVDINDLNVGDEVIAYDINDGHLFTNILEAKTKWTYDMLPAVPPVYELDAEGNIVYDEDGNPVILEPGKTSEQVFQETYGDWKFYLINNTWVLYCNQSVWANMNVTHASQLQLGDIVYDDQNQDVVITSIEEVTAPDWWRLQVSGDHSYIADNLTLHNASRYWVGGGSSSNWNATGNTNWGSTSGGTNNASVPVSTDDVTFDGAGPSGNTNSTISAIITILSLNITTGYTSTMTHNALLTIAGNWTYTGGYTIAGTSGITISANSTITSNGVTWPNGLTFSYLASGVYTLVGNLTVTGLIFWETVGSLNKTTTETLTANGGLNIDANRTLSGSSKVILKGGTWSNGNNSFLAIDADIDGNITLGTTVIFGGTGKTLKYVSGTITTTGSTFYVYNVPVNIDLNGMTLNNVTLSNTTVTLLSNLSISGLLTIPITAVINTSVGATLTSGGGLSVNASLSGTAKVILTGGTWSGSSAISTNLDINGNVTVSGTVLYTGTNLSYISGTVATTASTLTISASVGGTITVNTNGITWNNVTFSTANPTIALTSNFVCSGLVTTSAGTTINTSVGATFTSGGGLTANATLTGTASIYLTGGTWSGSGQVYSSYLYLNGNVTISGNVFRSAGFTNYLGGTITTTGSTLSLGGACTFDTNGMTWNNITITIGSSHTLSSNFSMTGLLTTSAATTFNTSVGATLTIGGGLAVNNTLQGTAKVILTGGTWSGSGNLQNSLDIQGDVTVSGGVAKSGGTITYVSGTVTTTSSTLNITNSCTFNTNGITWSNVSFITNGGTHTLTSNFVCSGLVTISVGTTINTSVSANFTLSGGLTVNAVLTGTAKVILTGGTWSSTVYTASNVDIQGNVIFNGTVSYQTGTLTYISGTVTTTGSTLRIPGGCTLNTNGITWNDFTITVTLNITLTSNLTINGLLSAPSGGPSILKTTSETVTINGGLSIGGNYFQSSVGSADVYLTGGTWSGTATLGSNLYLNGNVTISGSVGKSGGTINYVSGTITTTGSTLNINANVSGAITLNTNGMTWNNVTFATSGPTLTLTSNFACSGLVTVSIGTILNTSVGATFTTSGGITLTTYILGTAKIVFTGGTWTATTNNYIGCDLDINGNVTISGAVYYGRGTTLNYISGIVTTTGSTLVLYDTCTLNTNGIIWNNAGTGASIRTYTLTSNFYCSGLFTISATTTLNTSVGATLTSGGGLTVNAALSGTAKVVLTGGTWSGNGVISTNLDINGNVTVSGTFYFGGASAVLTYISGNVTTTGSIFRVQGPCTLNTKGIVWNTVQNDANTKTLTSDFTATFLNFVLGSNWNATTNEKLISLNGIYLNGSLTGTADFYLKGGTWSITGNGPTISTNMFFDGDITFSGPATGDVRYFGGTITYLSGKITHNNTALFFTGNSTVINFHKCPLSSIVITAGQAITMNEFFCGTPSKACSISSTGANYTIAFQNRFEKIAKYVKVTGATISNAQQLLIITNPRFNTNRTTNSLGIRYYNQSPNGVPKRAPSINDTMTVPALGLVNDPCFQYA